MRAPHIRWALLFQVVLLKTAKAGSEHAHTIAMGPIAGFACDVGVRADDRIVSAVQGDQSGRLKPPVDFGLGSSGSW